mmetsp:Transcript_58226/g.134414  ORF Transcript_58226/g.134414 Transcript_58226/m.134414 type:complete len:90 (+) Transcript_58226:1142-1411(+)
MSHGQCVLSTGRMQPSNFFLTSCEKLAPQWTVGTAMCSPQRNSSVLGMKTLVSCAKYLTVAAKRSQAEQRHRVAYARPVLPSRPCQDSA